MNKILIAFIGVLSVALAIVAQTVDRKPIKPIRPFVVMTGQSITDLQQKTSAVEQSGRSNWW